MLLSIKGLPPLASHITAIFIGFFLANFSYNNLKFIDVTKYRAIIALPRKFNILTEINDYIYLMKKNSDSDNEHCYIRSSRSMVIENKRKIIIALNYKQIPLYINSFTSAMYSIVSDSNIKDSRPCHSVVDITYGS